MVISGVKLEFINEMSSSVLKSIMDFSDLKRNILKNGKVSEVNAMDVKVFYLYEVQKQNSKEIDHEVSISSHDIKIDYSLRDILMLNSEELSNMIFAFDPKLTKSLSLHTNERAILKIDKIIRNLRCMIGINSKYIPKFKFIQFKKSLILDYDDSGIQKTLLCFNDISQKVFHDNQKAEKELLTLINKAISHEMYNPLNSILNQCEIMSAHLIHLFQIIKKNYKLRNLL